MMITPSHDTSKAKASLASETEMARPFRKVHSVSMGLQPIRWADE